jgi:hypothetical protein
MKKLLLLSALLFTIITSAQVPQGISYQAIALNGSGNPVVSSNVGIRLSVLDVSATGTTLYTETQIKTTTAQGLFNLVIGQGTPVLGTFAAINWKTNLKFLKVEMDVAGGTNYVLVGTTQLLSVPYALAAKSLVLAPGEGITLTSPNGTPYNLTVNDGGELSLPTSNTAATLPSQLYLYGSFNGWDASGALQFSDWVSTTSFRGYKYLTAGTQIKFLAAQNENTVFGGSSISGTMVSNGPAITIPSTAFYSFSVDKSTGAYTISSINVENDCDYGVFTMAYNANEDYFFRQTVNPGGHSFNIGSTNYGDNLGDGSLDIDGAEVFVGSTTKTFKVHMNFNTTGTLTITYP